MQRQEDLQRYPLFKPWTDHRRQISHSNCGIEGVYASVQCEVNAALTSAIFRISRIFYVNLVFQKFLDSIRYP